MAVIYLNEEARMAFEDNSSKPIYRYCSLENALTMISKNSFWFSNPIKWPDPFERLFIDAEYLLNGAKLEFPYKGKLFCMCVTQEINSEATWNAYSSTQIAIQFELNTKAFINLLEKQTKYDVFIGKMNYLPTKDIWRNSGPEGFKMSDLFDSNIDEKEKLKLLLLKRVSFEYENEFRIILISKSKTDSTNGVNIKIPKIKTKFPKSIKEIIPSIKIGPSKNNDFVSALKKILVELVDSEISASKLKRTLKAKVYNVSKVK
ncbi:MAG: hypothetical protein M1445_18660 [Bacteroidetes bacterium]|nr:hypothetical protein [Bacteroidota bacterium]MCL6102995.1 hypothetical protein [Bacteroidota bacterium]